MGVWPRSFQEHLREKGGIDMKTINKAMIAVMIAAVMCAVPLFVIDDSEAITITTGDAGVSFKAGSVSDEDFAKLTGGDNKETTYAGYARSVMSTVIDEYNKFTVNASTVKITNVEDYRLSRAAKLTEDSYATTKADEITFDIEFTATASSAGDLFILYDGTQTLYIELGKTNRFVSTNTVTFKGTATIGTTMTKDCSIAKTYGNNYITTEGTLKTSEYKEFSGEVIFNNGVAHRITVSKAATGNSTDSSFEYDFYGVEPSNLTSDSKYMKNNDGTYTGTNVFKYKINNRSDGYDRSYNQDDFPSRLFANIYSVGTVEDLEFSDLFTFDLSVPEYLYYDGSLVPTPSTCLFDKNCVADESLKDNDRMREFLDGIGTVGSTYSDAESVTNAAFESVGSSGGNSNIIFYVIIGVLSVAVVALAVLMIRKK